MYCEIDYINGLKVVYKDGTTSRKDPNNIWIYQLFLHTQTHPWETRERVIDEQGKMILIFP